MSDITIGNDYELGVQLTKNRQPFVIDFAYTIKAAVVNSDHTARYFDPVIVSPATPGADLNQSLIIVKFTAAQTAAITRQGPAKIEIALTEGGAAKAQSWFVDVRAVKGLIA